jgi:lysophospholipase L1-like esterase
MQFRLIEYDPDVLIIMHNINDSSVNSFLGGATSDYSNKYLQPYYLNSELQGSLSVYGFLFQSRLLTKLGVPALLLDKRGDLNLDNDSTYGLHLFKRNLNHIVALCKENNIEVLLLSQPYRLGSHKYVNEKLFMKYNEGIEEVARDHEVQFIDMFAEMGHDPRLFVDQLHYSPEGISKFSKILAPKVLELIDATH